MKTEKKIDSLGKPFVDRNNFDKETPEILNLISSALDMLEMTKMQVMEKPIGVIFLQAGSKRLPVLNTKTNSLSIETRGLVRLKACDVWQKNRNLDFYPLFPWGTEKKWLVECHMFFIKKLWYPNKILYKFIDGIAPEKIFRGFNFILSPNDPNYIETVDFSIEEMKNEKEIEKQIQLSERERDKNNIALHYSCWVR